MGQNAADFIFIEEIHDPCRCRYGCVGRISSGCKGVGHVGRNDVDFGHRQIGTLRQIGYDAVQIVIFSDLFGLISPQYHGIAEPIGEEIHTHGDNKHNHDAAAAAENAAQSHEDTGQGRHEEYRFHTVHKTHPLQKKLKVKRLNQL